MKPINTTQYIQDLAQCCLELIDEGSAARFNEDGADLIMMIGQIKTLSTMLGEPKTTGRPYTLPEGMGWKEFKEEVGRSAILDLFEKNDYNVKKTATTAGVTTNTVIT